MFANKRVCTRHSIEQRGCNEYKVKMVCLVSCPFSDHSRVSTFTIVQRPGHTMFSPAWYRPVRDPVGENRQDDAWNGFRRRPDVGHRRSAPQELPYREWDPIIRRWRQGPQVLWNFKPKHYFTRPHDGKRPGALGRLKDAFTREGADVFITSSGDERTLMRDRPQRWQWAGWGMTPAEARRKALYDKDFRWQDFEPILDASWTQKKRDWKPYYNFRNRKWEHPLQVWSHPDRVWTDARWPEGARHSSRRPLTYRDLGDQWWSRVPWWAQHYPGGRPRRPY